MTEQIENNEQEDQDTMAAQAEPQEATHEEPVDKQTRERHDLTGMVFKNDRKNKKEHPDFTGSVLIEGKEYWLSGWSKISRQGDKYMSLSFRPKGESNGEAIL